MKEAFLFIGLWCALFGLGLSICTLAGLATGVSPAIGLISSVAGLFFVAFSRLFD